MKKKLLISHSDNSTEFAKYIHQNFELLHPNVDTWYSEDPNCLPDGPNLSTNIVSATQDCFACLAIITKRNMDRWWMTFEAGCFVGMGKPVFAVLCGESLPYNSKSLIGYPITTLGTKFSTMTDADKLFGLLVTINGFLDESQQYSENLLKSNVANNLPTIIQEYNKYFSPRENDIDDMISKL